MEWPCSAAKPYPVAGLLVEQLVVVRCARVKLLEELFKAALLWRFVQACYLAQIFLNPAQHGLPVERSEGRQSARGRAKSRDWTASGSSAYLDTDLDLEVECGRVVLLLHQRVGQDVPVDNGLEKVVGGVVDSQIGQAHQTAAMLVVDVGDICILLQPRIGSALHIKPEFQETRRWRELTWLVLGGTNKES